MFSSDLKVLHNDSQLLPLRRGLVVTDADVLWSRHESKNSPEYFSTHSFNDYDESKLIEVESSRRLFVSDALETLVDSCRGNQKCKKSKGWEQKLQKFSFELIKRFVLNF